MTSKDELIHQDTEQWEKRELGASEAHVRRADVDAAAIDESLGLTKPQQTAEKP